MPDTDAQTGALYNRYRPSTFSTVVGQQEAAQILHASVVNPERRSHAYLLSGPRGCGKTTLARIFAKSLNCLHVDRDSGEPVSSAPGEPCNRCDSCRAIDANSSLDYEEIQAADHNGVDQMRALIRQVALSSPGEYRIVFLDEVHQLTSQAMDAFLKVLEEPPGHVIFLLATTSRASLKDTIQSRCTPVPLRLIPPDLLVSQLQHIAVDAGLDVPDEVVREAALRGRGSMRDSLSHLQALALSGLVSEGSLVLDLVDALISLDRLAVLKASARAALDGESPRALAELTVDYLRDMFFVQQGAGELVTAPDVDGRRAERARQMGARRTVQAMDALGNAIMAMRSDYDQRVNLDVNLARFCVLAAQG